MKNSTIAFCTVDSEGKAYDIVQALKSRGFGTEEISVLLPNHLGTTQLAHEAHTKAPEGASIGAATGGVVGGLVGLLAGIGTLAIPGLGPLIAAGPILATLSGMAAGGAIGGISGALVGMGLTEVEAKLFEGRIREGHIVITADCGVSDQKLREAKQVFSDHEARDITSITAKAPPERKTGDVVS
jgi:hypothetical protein